MLNPNARSLYTSALTPPLGMVFDEAVGTTFSLDPSVLLCVPVHLALLSAGRENPLKDGIPILESLQRLSSRITVYGQRGRILVPGIPLVLYGLLESMIVEVKAPRGGVFHPKLWVIRFKDPEESSNILLRLIVLSRNLTKDRSWDVALTLEGVPGSRYITNNRELGELIRDLPTFAALEENDARIGQADRLGDELRRTPWELPLGYENISFEVLGRKKATWIPKQSNRLAVISPFCDNEALHQIAGSSVLPDVLLSRPETFDNINPETRARFKKCFVLNEAAETEDGEDIDLSDSRDTFGLHAKVYIVEEGWNTHIALGSANATNAALLGAKNIEVLAILTGRRSVVGGIESLTSSDGFGEVLVEYTAPDHPVEEDLQRQAAMDALEKARDALVESSLQLQCNRVPNVEQWQLSLRGNLPRMEGIAAVLCWPITVDVSRAVSYSPEDPPTIVVLGDFGPASITGLIAVELQAAAKNLKLRFVLNLFVNGLPEERIAAILQTVVRNKDGFLRYLLLLLGDQQVPVGDAPDGEGLDAGSWTSGSSSIVPLLEELVRAYSRHPEKLEDVSRVVKRLISGKEKHAIVPEAFMEIWQVFEKAMKDRKK